MKFWSLLMIFIIIVFSIAGCSNTDKTDYSNEGIIVEDIGKVDDGVSKALNGDNSIEEGNKSEINEGFEGNQDYETVIKSHDISLETETYEDEAKINIIMQATTDEEEVWSRNWKDIYLTELLPHSEMTMFKDRIYIVIQGMLYCIDRYDGSEVFEPVTVGASELPVVDDEGNVYCSGYYGPFITKINYDGDVVWQINESDDMYYPYSLELKGNYIYVSYDNQGDTGFNTVQISADTGIIRNYYWIDKWSENSNIVWEDVFSSSELKNYPLMNLLDRDEKTAWVEGKSDDGINEWIQFKSNKVEEIEKIIIFNGYFKSKDLYKANNRINVLKIQFDNGEVYTVELQDVMQPTEIEFDEVIKTKSIKFIIEDVYSGSKYNDTVISGLYTY